MSDTQIDSQTEPCPACGSVLDVTGAQIFAERTCPVCGTQINVRRTFGHYELTGAVGHGGQGIVYRAVDNTLNRMVALKLLRTEYSSDPEFVRQFESEARVTASINHPNVVRVFSFGSGEGHVFLAMELVDSGTFDDLMEKVRRVPEARALQVGIEIAQGLKAGYEKGLVHRDVKPGNILFASDGTSKIVDFGLAMFFEQTAAQTGEIWGTPYYLSPERLNRVQEDFRSDIYSLGATLFHAIAGRPPFEAEDASHVALKHLRTQAASIQAYAPDVSNATAYVLNRTLAKNTADRQQSYDEFIEQLQFARDEVLARARGGGGQQKSRVVLDDVGSQRAMSWVTIATLIVLVVGLAIGGLVVAKVLRKDKGTVEVPAEVGAATLERFGPGWSEAKAKLLGGDYPAAVAQFGLLVEKHPVGSTERSWAMVLEALARQLNGDTAGAGSRLAALAGGGTQVSKFYSEQVASKISDADAVAPSVSRDFSRNNHESLAPLFFALKDIELGKMEEARALMGQFFASKPDVNVAWLSDLRSIAKPMQDEFDAYGQATVRWGTAKSLKEKEEALSEVRMILSRIPVNSKISLLARKFIADSELNLQQLRQERMKSNVLVGSKITATSWHQQTDAKPEHVLDGDVKSRWRNGDGDKARTLTFDLGSPKPMSRWVIKTAGATVGKQDDNLAEAKLQKSDDGNTWSDVDGFKENRAGTIDRVVPPFTSRYVRVVGGKGVKDDIIRIHELEVGAASEQTKTVYAPAEPVASRFSADSDFVAGPIGNPAVLGSVTYNAGEKSYTVKGSGSDVWGNNDNFQFQWQAMKGDCEISVCVRTFETLHDWSKALVMVRSDLTRDASHGLMAIGAAGRNQMAWRLDPGKLSESDNKPDIQMPYWIKVVRKGPEIIGYRSADGKKWDEMGKKKINGLRDVAFVGFGVCSHVDGQIATAKFTDVSLIGTKP